MPSTRGDQEQSGERQQHRAIRLEGIRLGERRSVACQVLGPLALVEGRQERAQAGALEPFDDAVDPGDLDGYLPSFMSARVRAGLRGRAHGAAVYLPQAQAPF